MKKATRPEEQSRPLPGQSITTSTRPAELLEQAPSKIARVLAYLLPESGAIELPQIEEIPTTKPDKGFKAVAA